MDPQLLKQITPYIVPILVIALVGRRLVRNAPQKVRIGSLWIMPLVMIAATLATLAATPAPGLFWIVGYILAAALGGTVGFLTSHHQEFSIDYDTGSITSKATPVGTILIGALFALRFGLKLVFPQLNGGGYAAYGNGHIAHPSADVIAWTDAGLIFSCAMLGARATTTWLRTRPLIAAHKAHKEASAGPPTAAGT